MLRSLIPAALGLLLIPAMLLVAADKPADAPKPDADGFYSLFDGKSLAGWTPNESPDTWKVENGAIVINGPKSHLFYTGPVKNADFKNFHFKAEVMTFPNANSGIYFHTKFQKDGWPAAGFECQVNNTYVKDPRKTASLYAIKDVKEQIAEDGKWFLYEIIVKDKKIEIKINGKTANEYEVPEGYKPPAKMEGRVLGSGTFALQGHDPGSKVMYRNIAVKPLD
jgi:hypothetical protein